MLHFGLVSYATFEIEDKRKSLLLFNHCLRSGVVNMAVAPIFMLIMIFLFL